MKVEGDYLKEENKRDFESCNLVEERKQEIRRPSAHITFVS